MIYPSTNWIVSTTTTNSTKRLVIGKIGKIVQTVTLAKTRQKFQDWRKSKKEDRVDEEEGSE